MNPPLRPSVPPLVAIVTALVLAALAGAFALWRSRSETIPSSTPAVAASALLPALDGASGWLNGGPLTPDSLRGHPTAIVVWSDADPRSLRALPEVQSWYLAYARYGARVIGVHAPDYAFGADPAVPAGVARRFGLGFPIALDPSHHIRARLDLAERRPGIVVADTSGRVVLMADGDRLPEVDRMLREQIRRLHPELGFPAEAGTLGSGAPRDQPKPRFVDLGTGRASRGPLAGMAPGRTETFTTQFRFQEEGEAYVPHPVGRWTPRAEGVVAARGGASNFVAIRYEGGRVSALMAPPASGATKVWILCDDAWLDGETRGDDVRIDPRGASYVEVTEPRLYAIAHGAKAHVLKLSPEEPGVTLYNFTFEK